MIINRISLDGADVIIREYLSPAGKNLFRDWLRRQDLAVRCRIQARVARFEHGNFGDCRSLGQGVFEARVHLGPGYRIYFGKTGDCIILLLCAGLKSSQRRDIKLAMRLWQDYHERGRG